MSDTIHARLADIFRIVFELPDRTDLGTVHQAITPAWDSLAHVTLVVALESEFEIEISAADSLEITSFDAALSIVEELAAEQSL